jgi:16S rRNA (guanine527-N7)-methyltransferase
MRYRLIHPNQRIPWDVERTLEMLLQGMEHSSLGFIPEKGQEKLKRFLVELWRFQPLLRLVSELNPEEMALHLLEAAAIAKRLRPKAQVLDIGPGGGFPALPMAILHNEASLILIERRQKVAAYLERSASALGLNHVRVLPVEYERFQHQKGLGPIHEITAKAVWPWKAYIRKVLPFLLEGVRAWVFQTPALETKELDSFLGALSGHPASLCSFEVQLYPGGKSRRLFGVSLQESS